MSTNDKNDKRDIVRLDDGHWFDRNKAEKFCESTHWDGSNHISNATGSQWDHEELYRTRSGRWVLCWWIANAIVLEELFSADPQETLRARLTTS